MKSIKFKNVDRNCEQFVQVFLLLKVYASNCNARGLANDNKGRCVTKEGQHLAGDGTCVCSQACVRRGARCGSTMQWSSRTSS